MALIFVILVIIDSSTNVFAKQTSGIIQLDELNHYGEVSIKNFQVSEKEFYKVIHLNIQIKVKDLALEDGASVFPKAIKLVNENGKSYLPTREECTIPDPLIIGPQGGPCHEAKNDCGMPNWWISIKGTEGGIGEYHPCFRVEKEFNNFKVYYTLHVGGLNYKDYEYLIGDIAVDQKLTPDIVSNVKNINMTKPQDFFTQFFEWLRNLFNLS